MAIDLKALKENLRTNRDLKAAAAALVSGVADQLNQLTHDPVAIKVLADELHKEAEALAAAIVGNTHSDTTPTPPVTQLAHSKAIMTTTTPTPPPHTEPPKTHQESPPKKK